MMRYFTTEGRRKLFRVKVTRRGRPRLAQVLRKGRWTNFFPVIYWTVRDAEGYLGYRLFEVTKKDARRIMEGNRLIGKMAAVAGVHALAAGKFQLGDRSPAIMKTLERTERQMDRIEEQMSRFGWGGDPNGEINKRHRDNNREN